MGARLRDLESGEAIKLGADFMEEGYRVSGVEREENGGTAGTRDRAPARSKRKAPARRTRLKTRHYRPERKMAP
jgi:hypothetical protein